MNSFWNTIDKIKSTLSYSDHQIAEIMELKPSQYAALKLQGNIPKITSGVKLCNYLNVSLENLITGSIDYSVLKNHLKLKSSILPQKYTYGAFGRRRTLINIFDYLEKWYGWEKVSLVLRKFQMSYDLFLDPEAPINNLFIVDLLQFLSKVGFTDLELFMMGAHSAHSNKNSPIAKKIKKSKTPQKLMQLMIEDRITDLYDQNFYYELQELKEEHCVVNIHQREAVAESLKLNKMGSKQLSINKAGVFSSMTCLAGFPQSKVIRTKSTHEGNDYCQYRLEFLNH